MFTQTIPVLLAGGVCTLVAGFEADVDAVAAVLPPEAGVAAGAGLLAGAVETAGAAAGVVAALEAGSAEVDFFEELFFGAAAPLSADAAVLAVESAAAAVFFEFFLGLAVSEVVAEAEEAEASLFPAEADFFELLFLGSDEAELSAAAASPADALFLEELFFFDDDAVELSVVAFSPAAVDLVEPLFFFEDAAPASADAWEVEASGEAASAFFVFLDFFLAESVWV